MLLKREWNAEKEKEIKMPGNIKILCITNRHLAVQDYFEQIRQIALARPQAVIVREKDLAEHEYRLLAARVMDICGEYHVPCILHGYPKAAASLGAGALHLPLSQLLSMPEDEKQAFKVLGASVHSPREALLAQKAGASYVTAGHVFATDCKRGVPPRGLSFLRETCQAVQIPVYALGGIQAQNAAECILAGAQGVCVMSACMKYRNVRKAFGQYGYF